MNLELDHEIPSAVVFPDTRIQHTKVPHTCWCCGAAIPVGSPARRYVTLYLIRGSREIDTRYEHEDPRICKENF